MKNQQLSINKIDSGHLEEKLVNFMKKSLFLNFWSLLKMKD